MVILKQTRLDRVCKVFGGFTEVNCSEVTLLFKLLILRIPRHPGLCCLLLLWDFLAIADC